MSEISLRDLMAEKLGGGKPKRQAKLHATVHKSEDGKYLVEHNMHGGDEHVPSTQYAPGNFKELVAHLGKHYNEEPEPPVESAPAGA